jgi:long-chain acyl-CoA synthetase
VVVDRMKDVMVLGDGSKFSPQYIENKLKFSPYIKEAVVIGQDRPYVAALINIDMATVGKWAESRQISFTTYTDLSQKGRVYDLITADVERVNRDLPRAARIARFVLLYKELDPDDEEMTRTRKVRRRFVESRYANLIQALYDPSDEVVIDAEIKYQSGQTSRMRTRIKVRTVEEPVAA